MVSLLARGLAPTKLAWWGGAITSHWTGARSAGLSSARLGCLVRSLRARSIPTLCRYLSNTIMKTSRLITIVFVGFLLCANVSLAQRKKTQKPTATTTVPNAQTEWKTAASSETYLIEFSPKRLTRLSPTIIRVWTRRQFLGEKPDR